MKLQVPLIWKMGLLLAIAGVAGLDRPCLHADDLKARTMLGTPKKQATFGVGFDTSNSHLALALQPGW